MRGRVICPSCQAEMILISVTGRLVIYKCPFCGARIQFEDPDLRENPIDESQLPDLPDYDLWRI